MNDVRTVRHGDTLVNTRILPLVDHIGRWSAIGQHLPRYPIRTGGQRGSIKSEVGRSQLTSGTIHYGGRVCLEESGAALVRCYGVKPRAFMRRRCQEGLWRKAKIVVTGS